MGASWDGLYSYFDTTFFLIKSGHCIEFTRKKLNVSQAEKTNLSMWVIQLGDSQ